MKTQELVDALKRGGHTIGSPEGMSHDGYRLLNIDGRLMKENEAEKLLTEKVSDSEIK